MRVEAGKTQHWVHYKVIDASTGLTMSDVVWADDVTHEIGVLWPGPQGVAPSKVPKVIIIPERFTVLINVRDVFEDVDQEALEGLYA